jgi:signal transduction histidine kinase
MKATVEFDIHNMKDIEVYISEGSTDLIIKISDFGGGFSRNNLDKIFSYSYTTTSNTIINDTYPIHHSNYERKPILSGLGYGVPLSRLYCKYFQGDLKLIPYEGIGTDALIFINKIGDKNENIG